MRTKRVDDSAMVMMHYSSAYYSFEGIKEDKVHYRCRLCLQHLHISINTLPQSVHPVKPLHYNVVPVDTGIPARGYVDQG